MKRIYIYFENGRDYSGILDDSEAERVLSQYKQPWDDDKMRISVTSVEGKEITFDRSRVDRLEISDLSAGSGA